MQLLAPSIPVIERLADRMRQIPMVEAIAALSLFLLVTWTFDGALARIAGQVALVAVLLKRDLLRSPVLWAALALINSEALVETWSVADNHKYLLVYWLWVMTFATYASDDKLGEAVISWHARFFLVFVFLVAALQKLFAPTYMSGEMFELKLLLDERFQAFGHLLGFDKSSSDAARIMILRLKSPLNVFDGNAVLLAADDTSRRLALVITWYDLLVQVAIGLLFVPALKVTDRIGHLALLFFIYTTYLPAPVFGFGWTLSIYGLALSYSRFKLLPLAYAGSFLAVLAYQAPWRAWVLSW